MKFLFFLCFVNQVYAQRVSTYHKSVNMAEIAIVKNQWHEATYFYNIAFNNHKTAFAKDYHNAILCLIKVDSIEEAVNLSRKLLDFDGIDVEYFNDPCFHRLISSVHWRKIKEKKKSKKNNNENLKNELRTRYKLDQDVKNKERKDYFISNVKWLKALFLSDILPNEREVGFTQNNIKSCEIEIMIYHWAQIDKKDTFSFSPLLRQMVDSQVLHPASFAALPIESLKNKYSRMDNFAFVVIGDSVLSPIFKDNEKILIDSNRLELGLAKFEDYQKIVLFSSYNPCFIFNNFRYLVLTNISLLSHFKLNGYEVIGDKKTLLNLN
jgi:hypothetical protein